MRAGVNERQLPGGYSDLSNDRDWGAKQSTSAFDQRARPNQITRPTTWMSERSISCHVG